MQGFIRIAVLFSLVLLGACAALQPTDFDPPTVELVGIKPLKSNGMEARFQLSVRVVNPNAKALEVEGVYYELYVEGNKVLTGASSDAATIPAFGEGRLELEASASMFGSFTLLTQLLDSQPKDGVAYELKAKISIAGLPTAVRINRQGTFGLPGK
jgi:LEA14-like dessication related protein